MNIQPLHYNVFFQPAELDLPALISLRILIMFIIVTSVSEVIQSDFVKWIGFDKVGFIHSALIIPELRLVW